jgi:iron complex transport system ATP-binding protein
MAAAQAIDRLALTPFITRALGSLSGGERQRVVLARALAQAAPILLLDEPTSALDLGRQQEALGLLDELRREDGLTVISAMHDLSLAGQYADRLILLDRGRIVADGSPHEVLTVETIAACYQADVRILHEEDRVFVLPRRRT